MNRVGIALSVERDYERLMELILRGSMELTNADGGTMYRVTKEKELRFEVIINQSLQIASGGTSETKINFPHIPLYIDGKPNYFNIVSCCVHGERTIKIDNVYNSIDYDFQGTRKFDSANGYKTVSMLTIPMKNHENDVIGALQLINCKDDGHTVSSFLETDRHLAESLASQAAVAVTNKELIADLQNLFDSFTQLIAKAIDEKSPYTGNHCRRIPLLTMMLADAVSATDSGPLATYQLSASDRLELNTAAWLHDCGKVTSPDFIMDKSTKLETICDRIEIVDLRIELLIHQIELEHWRVSSQHQKLPVELVNKINELRNARTFLRNANVGGESLSDEDINKVISIASLEYKNVDLNIENILSENEKYNLIVKRGTLNEEERLVINNHMVATVDMLNAMPFPKHLKRVPEFAGGHHERMDGKGYPKGLTKDEMSVPARVMAIADIFEALTASDRPYKKGKKISECLKIMERMSKEQHIDQDLFSIFIEKKIWLHYAQEELQSYQIDIIDWEVSQ
ncbi:MAG: HD domain-containing phosphohydrolase [Methylacidiphilales bacterium]|nr:HD domain-containing phosphohydrolase [Candidatus Methylacidiphilales bacterium]